MQALKKETRAPWWHWSGLLLLLVAACWGLVASTGHARDRSNYLAAPRVGDIYTVRVDPDSGNYSLLKVVSAGGNAVEVVANNYQIDNNHPIDELNSVEKYQTEPSSLTLLDLKIMHNKGELTDVDRLDE